MSNSSIDDYRRQADLCLRLAGTAESPEVRSFLVMMASAWHHLAQHVMGRFGGPRLVETDKHAPNETD